MLKQIFALTLTVGILSACLPNAATPPSSTGAPSSPSSPSNPSSSAFPYKKFAYDITTETMGMTMTSRVSSEVLSVTATEITVKTTVTVNGVTNESTTTSKLNDDGDYVPSSGSSGSPSNMTKVGNESVTVKAGTFNAEKYTYSQDGVTGTYWIADNMLVKSVTTASQQGVTSKSTMELSERQ